MEAALQHYTTRRERHTPPTHPAEMAYDAKNRTIPSTRWKSRLRIAEVNEKLGRAVAFGR